MLCEYLSLVVMVAKHHFRRISWFQVSVIFFSKISNTAHINECNEFMYGCMGKVLKLEKVSDTWIRFTKVDFCCVYYIFHCLLCGKCFTVFQQFTEKGTYWRQMTAISSWNPFFIFFILKWDKIYAWLTFFRASLFWGKY